MKKLLFCLAVCLLTIFTFQTTHADKTTQTDNWEIVIDLDFCQNANLEYGFYGNYSDCRWFYGCYKFETTAFQCTAGLVFDTVTQTCNWPFSSTNFAINCP